MNLRSSLKTAKCCAKVMVWFIALWVIGFVWIVMAAVAFVGGRWCAQLLGWY